MEYETMRQRRNIRLDNPLASAVAMLLSFGLALAASSASADPADAINQRLYEQLQGGPSGSKIETVSNQLYIAHENIDASVIGDALGALLDRQSGKSHSVAVQRRPRLNFEIHFEKNSADLTPESRGSLDELGKVLGSSYTDMRFVIGGHTDQDGDQAVNLPLSQARAEQARDYLVTNHAIAEERLVARGFGSAEPLRNEEKSLKDKQYNRRVDLRPLR